MTLLFTVDGAIEHIIIPAAKTPRRADFLWQHTCFEAFVRAEGSPSYHEINLSPSSEWAVYGFRAYRDIESIGEDAGAIAFSVSASDTSLQLTARIELARLSPAYRGVPLRLALSSVIEETDGSLSYWSLQHPPGQPDFHHDDAFTLTI